MGKGSDGQSGIGNSGDLITRAISSQFSGDGGIFNFGDNGYWQNMGDLDTGYPMVSQLLGQRSDEDVSKSGALSLNDVVSVGSMVYGAKGGAGAAAGSGSGGGPSLDMGTVGADGMRTFSEDGASSGGGMLGKLMGGSKSGGSPTASSPMEGGDILGRLLSFQSSMGSAQPQQSAMPAAKLMELSPRNSLPPTGTYNAPSANLIPNRSIADNRRY